VSLIQSIKHAKLLTVCGDRDDQCLWQHILLSWRSFAMFCYWCDVIWNSFFL